MTDSGLVWKRGDGRNHATAMGDIYFALACTWSKTPQLNFKSTDEECLVCTRMKVCATWHAETRGQHWVLPLRTLATALSRVFHWLEVL